jgi:hypothetical protein
MTRAADPLSAAIRICPLTVTMMAREVITERGPHPGSLRRESPCRIGMPVILIGFVGRDAQNVWFGGRAWR